MRLYLVTWVRIKIKIFVSFLKMQSYLDALIYLNSIAFMSFIRWKAILIGIYYKKKSTLIEIFFGVLIK